VVVELNTKKRSEKESKSGKTKIHVSVVLSCDVPLVKKYKLLLFLKPLPVYDSTSIRLPIMFTQTI
jgi:hypothetical protein